MTFIKKIINFSFIILFSFLLFPSITHSFKVVHNDKIIKDSYKLNFNHDNTNIINGKIIDSKTNEIIPFCNIIVKENNYATASNEVGEFSIKIDEFPVTIVISHLSYETKEVIVENKSALIVVLKSYENQLNEVILTNSDNKHAIAIVNKTINKYNSSKSPTLYARSLYRQKSKNDDSFSEFAEIIYDIEYDNDGIIDWNIFEGRYALKKETINNKNFTLLSKILRVHQPNSDDLIFPLRNEFLKYYSVKIINISNTKNGELVTINFTPLNNTKTPIIKANVIINTKNYDVIKFEGSLINDDIKIVTLGDKSAVKKNYKLNFEISYREDNSLGLVLDYININHEFDYHKEDKLLTHLYATSSLNFFEYYDENPKTKSKNRKRFIYKSSDWDKLDIVGYNKAFWDNNPIVKRTITENEVIQSFDELKAFESIFINAQQQISINGSDISNDPFILKISDNISKHYTGNLTQQVFLHTDKNKYSKNNKIYFSAYVTSEKADIIFNEKEVLYIDLISKDSVIDSKVIKISNGKGNGAFSLNKNFKLGNYKIVAYTNYMKNFNPNNFFIKNIEIGGSVDSKINSENDKITLSFYPEGGQIINGINNKVAYESQGSDGGFKDIKGKIVDSDGNFISILKSKYEGLGFFYLKPILGKSYTIILDDGSNYPIPKALTTGYSIIVDNINARTMTVNIRSSDDLKSNKIYVIGLMDNKKYYQGGFTFEGKDLINFEIPKNKFSSGVMQLVLLDASKKMVGFRSVYINKKDNVNIAAQLDKTYSDNEFIKLKIKTTNHITSASNISLSITKQLNDKPNDINNNLISQFKLSSFSQDDRMTKFINKTDRASNYKLDLMMLINDSSEFKWLEENLKNEVKKYQNEKSIDIVGTVKDKNDNPLEGIKLKLLTQNKERIWNYETKTGINGMFTINDFQEIDSTQLEFRTFDTKDKQIFSEISLDEENEFNYIDQLTFKKDYVSTTNNDNFLNNNNSAFNDEGELLEGVELKAKAKEKEKAKTSRKSLFNTNPDAIIEGKNIKVSSDIFTALSMVGGVRYVGGAISIRNGGSPLWTLDDMPIDGPNDVNVNDIDRIEVIKSMAKTAVYGPDGLNGVIAIYTKIGVNSKYKNDIKTSTFSKIGYSSAEEFNFKDKNDDTLYWSPSISTDENGYIDLLLKKPSNNIKFINVNIQAVNKSGEIGYFNKVLKLE